MGRLPQELSWKVYDAMVELKRLMRRWRGRGGKEEEERRGRRGEKEERERERGRERERVKEGRVTPGSCLQSCLVSFDPPSVYERMF